MSVKNKKSKKINKTTAEITLELVDKIEVLTEMVEAIKYPPKRKMMRDGLIKGIFWGFGKIIGLLIVFGILYLILANIDLVPGLGKWIAEIIKVVNLNI